MDFEQLLLENEGRDLYVKSVGGSEQVKRIKENILSRYRIMDNSSEDLWTIHDAAQTQVFKLSRSADIIKYDVGKRIPLITIHAQYRDILYYMYITDYISVESMQGINPC